MHNSQSKTKQVNFRVKIERYLTRPRERPLFYRALVECYMSDYEPVNKIHVTPILLDCEQTLTS